MANPNNGAAGPAIQNIVARISIQAVISRPGINRIIASLTNPLLTLIKALAYHASSARCVGAFRL